MGLHFDMTTHFPSPYHFIFLTTSEEIGWEARLQSDILCSLELDVNEHRYSNRAASKTFSGLGRPQIIRIGVCLASPGTYYVTVHDIVQRRANLRAFSARNYDALLFVRPETCLTLSVGLLNFTPDNCVAYKYPWHL